MEEETKTSKSIQFEYEIDGTDYTVKALITSLPEEVEIKNVERKENTDFVFSVNVITEPKLPEEVFDDSKTLIYSIGDSGDNLFGYLTKGELVEAVQNEFVQVLEVSILEVLLIAGNTGNFVV